MMGVGQLTWHSRGKQIKRTRANEYDSVSMAKCFRLCHRQGRLQQLVGRNGCPLPNISEFERKLFVKCILQKKWLGAASVHHNNGHNVFNVYALMLAEWEMSERRVRLGKTSICPLNRQTTSVGDSETNEMKPSQAKPSQAKPTS